MKTNNGLVRYCIAQLGKPYWYGTFGHKASESLLRQKSTQYPAFYRDKDFVTQYGEKVHDCAGLIKGYLWCDSDEGFYNPEKYDPEIDDSIDSDHCSEKGNIDNMPEIKGLLLFYPGHVGVYIGNGKVIEARGHAYGVVETNLRERPWNTWGKLDFITYKKPPRVFKDGEELAALDFLVEHGRIDSDKKDYWASAIDMIKYEKYIFIKWANDVSEMDA